MKFEADVPSSYEIALDLAVPIVLAPCLRYLRSADTKNKSSHERMTKATSDQPQHAAVAAVSARA